MNRTINVIRLGTPENARKSIKFIVDQLERHNYVITSDHMAVRLFSQFLPNIYKKNGIIIISRPNYSYQKFGTVITLSQEYKIERKNDFNFFIRLRK